MILFLHVLARWRCVAGIVLVFAAGSAPLSAAIIGTNPPAQPLTAERVATLPKKNQSVWKDYLKRSDRQRQTDQAFLRKEMRQHGVKQLLIPAEARGRRWLPQDRPAAWYGSNEGRLIADVILSFQTPAGGWSKNLAMTDSPRAPGMHFAADNSSRFPAAGDFDAPAATNWSWSYVGTFDNDATIMQMRFLAKVIAAVGPRQDHAYRASFIRGLDYILAAQYPHGGWPQVWPLQGAYHDGSTFNDNATINILTLLRDAAQGTNEFAFVPARNRRAAAAAFKRGTSFVLATQIVVDGRRTIWAQQYDPLTLEPTSARNYEMPSLAAGESAGVMLFLMQMPDPDPATVAAVRAAAEWFEKTKIRDVAFRNVGNDGRLLVPASGSGPLWARYYEIGSNRPLFGDRDKSIHDTVDEISRERRNGYAWYGDSARRALESYASWTKAHPR